MGRFAFWSAAYGAALWLVDRFTGAAPGFLWVLFWATFLPATLYYVVRLVRFFRERVLWRLRRRLVVTYLFMAVVAESSSPPLRPHYIASLVIPGSGRLRRLSLSL